MKNSSAPYDSCIMFTWSDWRTEPRGNRYHYASRFAKQVPVLFLQINGTDQNGKLFIEESEIKNLTIIQFTLPINQRQIRDFLIALRPYGIRNPLLWIYDSINYRAVIDMFPSALQIYHATEAYFIDSSAWSTGFHEVRKSIVELLRTVDLLVAVSEGVLESYVENAGFSRRTIIAENGCDFEFFNQNSTSFSHGESIPERRVIYQGGINPRLDWKLLDEITDLLADWTFVFCGKESGEMPEWQTLKNKSNVVYLGCLEIADVAREMMGSTVGIIPFHSDTFFYNTLPLKAFEYVACGLPVVSVPIKALSKHPIAFGFAQSAGEFATSIQNQAKLRTDSSALEARKKLASIYCYSKNFGKVYSAICDEISMLKQKNHRLNVGIIYDQYSIHVSTILEHLKSFNDFSNHHVYFLPAPMRGRDEPQSQPNLAIYDAIVVHYSIRICVDGHLDRTLSEHLASFHGTKILFMQDEYDSTETARRLMDFVRFDVVYTCVPDQFREAVFPTSRYPYTKFVQTLTGFVIEDGEIEQFAVPMRKRSSLIGYRGRKLPYVYGILGYEKWRIGAEMRKLADARGLPVDIEVDDDKRIYGTDWYRFLGSFRATLGTESGSNVFDYDEGFQERIEAELAAHPESTFDEIHSKLIAPFEAKIRMNQISPKIFEAIQLRVALILFEGDYSGIVQPDVHYIPLKKDFSNIEDVFLKVQDVEFLEELTDRAYCDIVGEGRYSYRHFVNEFDQTLNSVQVKGPGHYILGGPITAIRAGKLVEISSSVFDEDPPVEPEPSPPPPPADPVPALVQLAAKLVVKLKMEYVNYRDQRSGTRRKSASFFLVRLVSVFLPTQVKKRIVSLFLG